MDRQPMLSPQGPVNVYDPEDFDVVATYGNAALASYFGREVTLARTNTGELTLTFPQTYRHVTRVTFAMQDAAGGILFPVVKSDTVKDDGKLVIETRTEAGVATDPAEGDKLFISVRVSRNFLNDQHAATVPE